MVASWTDRSLTEVALFVLVIIRTHLVMSGVQTLMHYWLGHSRLGGPLFRNHINFHHTRYARSHLVSTIREENKGNNTPFFLIPVSLAALLAFFVLPFDLFVAAALTAGASFYAHVHLDKAHHFEGSSLERFAWYRRKQQRHFVHHLHANCNFAVMDFFLGSLVQDLPEGQPGQSRCALNMPFHPKQDCQEWSAIHPLRR
jgi:hypothetical protein